MSLFVLDTDMLTLVQEGHPGASQRFLATPAHELAITVLTVEEQLSGWYTQVRKAKRPDRLAWAYRRLAQNVGFLARLQIVTYDEAAIQRCDQLRKQNVKLKTFDLRIAAIVLEQKAILVTRNKRDFEKVPGLPVEDWSR
jgi:tRNA(fMet)-specific endonuclease VapC